MATVWLVRHGHTALNGGHGSTSPDRIRGWKDIPLTSEGHAESRELAGKFEDKGIDRIYSSDLSRASDVAEEIGSKVELPIHKSEAFRPWNLGEYQGQETNKVIDDLDRMVENKDEKPKDGETFCDFLDRFIPALSEVMDQSKATEHNSVIVSHYRNLKAAESWIKNGMNDNEIDPETMKKDDMPPGSALRIDWTGKQWRLSKEQLNE